MRGIALAALLALMPVDAASQAAILRYQAIHHPVQGSNGMVVSQRRLASQIGADILGRGGNAADAAIATAFALAVVLPRAGNLAGGGFLLVHDAKNNREYAIDFRERAPAAATAKMFQREDGTVDQQRYRYSALSTGVPGTVRGLHDAWQRFGSLPWRELVAPAIRIAREGFTVSYDLASALDARKERLTQHPYTRALFFKPGGASYVPGEQLRLPDLARTLEAIAEHGPRGFYTGRVAEAIVAEMARSGGLISMQDLADYQTVERAPVYGEFNGHSVVSMPPPSSGGVHLVQMLNVLSHFPLDRWGAGTARTLHVMAETMKLAYADRSRHLGDPDFADVPVGWLTSADYARELAQRIELDRAKPALEIAPGVPPRFESEDTTHLSVMDRHGNAVALTTTLNFSFGNGIAVPGTGMLLNNEMTDFSAKAGEPDGFGLITGAANAVEPGKRPLSAMTPTLVKKGKRVVLTTGSPGGSRIINAVLQQVLGVVAFEQNVAQANHAARIHHQWQPDRLQVEKGIGADTLVRLRSLGHPVEQAPTMGSVQSIGFDGSTFFGSADPRRPGAAAVPAKIAAPGQ